MPRELSADKFSLVFYDGALDLRIKDAWLAAVLSKALNKFALEHGPVVGPDGTQMALELTKASSELSEWADKNKVDCTCPTCKAMAKAKAEHETMQQPNIESGPTPPPAGHYV